MESLKDNHTWDLVARPKANIVKGRWVFKRKLGSDGKVARYKARYVAKGFTQTGGVDFNETFASVAKMKTFRALLARAAHSSMRLEQLDVKTAFLYGDIKETVYVEQPAGFCSDKSKVCRLHLLRQRRDHRLEQSTISLKNPVRHRS